MFTRSAATMAFVLLFGSGLALAQERDLLIKTQGGYGSCPHGYDFSYRSGRCYPNESGERRRYRRGYDDDGPAYGRRGLCPHGADFNYRDGRCYTRGGRY